MAAHCLRRPLHRLSWRDGMRASPRAHVEDPRGTAPDAPFRVRGAREAFRRGVMVRVRRALEGGSWE